VRGVDITVPEYSRVNTNEFELLDLRRRDNCLQATRGFDEVNGLAADMGGMGLILAHHSEIPHNNSLINTHTLEAARVNGIQQYFNTSSAYVYPGIKQTDTNVTPFKQEGIHRLMGSDHVSPRNFGSVQMATIHKLADMVAEIAGIMVATQHLPEPLGVRGRNPDNTRLREVLKWAPYISLEAGLHRILDWIEKQVAQKLKTTNPA
jgi:nucleoside-diphosphate-sugar epimerase